MKATVGLITSAVGAYFCGMDFCTLLAFVLLSIDLHNELNLYANDKAVSQRDTSDNP